jgi:hypothetical protein
LCCGGSKFLTLSASPILTTPHNQIFDTPLSAAEEGWLRIKRLSWPSFPTHLLPLEETFPF